MGLCQEQTMLTKDQESCLMGLAEPVFSFSSIMGQCLCQILQYPPLLTKLQVHFGLSLKLLTPSTVDSPIHS